MPTLRHWLEPRVLGIILAAALALWLFIEVADEVIEGDTHSIDAAILMSLRSTGDPADPVGPRWVEEFARDITALGGPGVLSLLVVATTAFLLLADRPRIALFVLAATTSGAIVAGVLKEFFARPRPDLVPHDVYVFTASFPSGHAMVSAVVYLTLGALLARLVPRRRLKVYVLSVAVLITGLVGISRVYLGVHWPSDVLAGWAAGAAWALGCWGAAQAVHLGQGESR